MPVPSGADLVPVVPARVVAFRRRRQHEPTTSWSRSRTVLGTNWLVWQGQLGRHRRVPGTAPMVRPRGVPRGSRVQRDDRSAAGTTVVHDSVLGRRRAARRRYVTGGDCFGQQRRLVASPRSRDQAEDCGDDRGSSRCAATTGHVQPCTGAVGVFILPPSRLAAPVRSDPGKDPRRRASGDGNAVFGRPPSRVGNLAVQDAPRRFGCI